MLAFLPDHWFETLLPNTFWGNLGLVVLGLVCLVIVVRGADWLVTGAVGLALRLGLSKMVIGATIVSLGTTSPEAAVSVLAAWSGSSGLALGNGVGSIIVDTGLVFALGCLWMRLPADRFLIKRQGLVDVGVALALVVICYGIYAWHGDALLRDAQGEIVVDGRGNPVPMARIARWVGVLLVGGLIVYLAVSVRWAREHTRWAREHAPAAPATPDPAAAAEEHAGTNRSVPGLVAIGVVGLAMVLVGGEALVDSMRVATTRWGVPEVVVAGTLVAFGTSLPELMVGVTSLRKGHPELMVGNVIGADILNVLFVIGAAALAGPLAIIEPGTSAPYIFLYLHLPVMLTMVLLLLAGIFRAVRTGFFSRWLGLPLLLLYIAFVLGTVIFSIT